MLASSYLRRKKIFKKSGKQKFTGIDVVTRLLPNGGPVSTGSYDFLAERLKFEKGARTGA